MAPTESAQPWDPTTPDDVRAALDGVGYLADDTLATAQAGGMSGNITGTLCPGDFDIISVGRLTDTQELAGAFDGSGIDGVRVQVLLDDWGAPRDFPTALSATGQYYLAVFSENPSATGTYTLNWSVR